MNLARRLALKIPPIRRLYDNNWSLRQQIESGSNSPFYHFHSTFNAQAVIRRHAVADLKPREGYLTNFLGVVVDPRFFPSILDGRAGRMEPPPIPADWHADIAEWRAALRAVDLARKSFTMIELGCGWGCWMNNTGMAARHAGLAVHVIGVEGDEGHLVFAREALAANGFAESEFTLRRGIAAARNGVCLFPRQERAGVEWGLEPVFDATPGQRQEAVSSGKYDELPMIGLADLIGPADRIDLLHIDIQGGEADFVAGCIGILSEKVAYLLVGTHSRQIEGSLFGTLVAAGWRLEIERPAMLYLTKPVPEVAVDGVQGWRNPRLLPAER